jgi:hypothetical protein
MVHICLTSWIPKFRLNSSSLRAVINARETFDTSHEHRLTIDVPAADACSSLRAQGIKQHSYCLSHRETNTSVILATVSNINPQHSREIARSFCIQLRIFGTNTRCQSKCFHYSLFTYDFRLSQRWIQRATSNVTFFLLASYFNYFPILKMEAKYSSETYVDFQWPSWRYILK